MKQKYTITVADMELNIISDASPDEVENIVGILDRRMRDINLRSPRCTKNEAAILCALSYCSERIAMQEAYKRVETDAFRFSGENEKLKKTIESMQEEIDRLRKDAAVMRSILDHAAAAAVAAEEKPAAPKKSVGRVETAQEAVAAVPMGDQISAFDAVPEELAAANAAEEAPARPVAAVAEAEETAAEEPAVKKPAKNNPNKTRVGTMFDLLTFSDV